MAFPAGTRLGPYEIVSPLGAGGMGEVYRARDTRLDRTVAVKVLKGALAADSESRRRFEHEARAIAALNDPHICTIHDVGRHGDLDYLVLEFLEGETLADRLRRAPALARDEALAIAIQIADALDRAHRTGIAHRDLKPGNVMLVRRGGAAGTIDVKLLDFGLAARTAATRSPALDGSMLATVAPSMAATQEAAGSGTALGISGTLQYMSPEQLDGETGDQRTDIFAFGCVLYEMIAGRKAFEGSTAATVIAAIVSSEPPPAAALDACPFLDHVVRRCLEKDRERRWQSIRDVALELRWAAEHPASATGAGPVPAAARRTPWVAAAAIAAAAGVAITALLVGPGAAGTGPRRPLRLEITTAPTDEPSMALSPDGTTLTFVAHRDRVPMLWLRRLDGGDSKPLEGTEGARFPFWSPDNRSIAFFADDQLKRIDVEGGAPLVVTAAPNGRGGDWNHDGVMLFAPGVSAPIMRVAARGGSAEAVTAVNTGSGPDHRWPQFLPDGRRFLFSSTLGTPETNGVYISSLDKTPPVRILPSEGMGRFAAPGTLLTSRQGALQAFAFDPDSGSVRGEPRIIAQGLAGGVGGIATSDDGVLAFRAGTAQRRQLAWVSRTGAVLQTLGAPETGSIASPELSPDGRSVVVFRQTPDNDVWVIELARNLARRVTNGPPADAHPLWDPDGEHVVFVSRRFSSPGPARQAVSGGAAAPLFTSDEAGMAVSWTRDRAFVLVRRDNGQSSGDLYAVSPDGSRPGVAVATSPFDETEGQFSPDGKWVALVSSESGRPEVFVQSFPEGRGRVQVSTEGGSQVRWSSNGREIFYVARDGTMMAVPIDLGGSTPAVTLPGALFKTHLATGTNVLGFKPQYAVAADGRFLLNTAIESASSPIVVSVNWMVETD